MYNISHLSLTPTGVQIVARNHGEAHKRMSYEEGHDNWEWFVECGDTFRNDVPELVGKRLVRVDINGWESQWSFI
jgi:hypothetical protein